MASLLSQYTATGANVYETGVKNVALYVMNDGKYGAGVAWNGVTNVTLSPSGAEATPLYADDRKYLNLISAEELGGTIEAYTYPDEFAECDGSVDFEGMKIGQQPRKTFALVFETTVGNETNSKAGNKLHVVYGCLAAPSEKAYNTINDSPEAITFSWELSTTPVDAGIDGVSEPTSYVELDSTKLGAEKYKALKDAFYGTEDEEPALLMPAAIYAIVKPAA